DRSSMEDPDGTLASVAQCIEQLRQSSSSSQERENSLRQLLELINTRENAFGAVGSHSQAVPVLVSLLRSGSFGIKIQAATVLGSLCKENELRVKVLLGGCIPPLLGLLKSNKAEGQIAAAKTIMRVSRWAKDHVGSKIFSTEGVVPVLWEQLEKGLKAGNEVDDLLTGALRNLSSSTEGFWPATIEAGGVDILVKLLNNRPIKYSGECMLPLGMHDDGGCISSVRAEAAGALKSLSAQCKEARREIANANGIPVLINATIAPSKEFMQGEFAQALQENAMCALANISGGLSYVISSLGQSLESCTSPAQVADTLGALASALMIYDSEAEYARASDPTEVEKTLVQQFKPRVPFLVQERTIEALASLYGNGILASKLADSDAKRLLVGLITMATNEVQEELIRSLLVLCNNQALLWLLKNGSPNGKEIAAKTLNHLIHKSDTATISQLTALLVSDLPESKVHVLDALKSLLCVAPLSDMVREGSAANDAIETMIKILSSTKEETQAKSALALAGIFDLRKDLRETNIAVKTLWSVLKLLNVGSESILVETSRCLAAIFLSVKENRDVAAVARDALPLLVVLANSSVLQVAEQAVCALANLLLDSEASGKAITEEIILPATRVLREGSNVGKTHAAAAIARLLHSRKIDSALTDCVNRTGTVLAIVSFLEAADGSVATSEALDALALLSRSVEDIGHVKPAWTVLAEYPSSITPIVSCIADATPLLQDKAIEILSRLSRAQPYFLETQLPVPLDAFHLLHKGVFSSCDQGNKDVISISRITEEEASEHELERSTSVISGANIAIWLLSVLASLDDKSKLEIMEAGAIEVLTDKISQSFSQFTLADYKEDSSIWICALLLAILLQDRDIIRAPATMKAIPVLASLLRSEEGATDIFAAQAVASLVCNGSRGTLLSVANSGAAAGLISLLGCADDDIHDLLELAEEFSLVRYPDQVALERLFRVDDIRLGATSRKAIPALVDLLKPIPDRPAEIRRHESAFGAVTQLVAVLRLGGRAARYSAAKALENLFSADHVRNADSARQAVQPLVEILNTGLEKEQHAAIAALVRLLNENPSRALAVADVEMNAVDVLCRILSSNYSMELKGDAAELCCYSPAHHSVVRALDKLLDDEQLAELVAAHGAVIPLVGLLYGRNYLLHEAISRALVKLGKDRPACKMEMVKAGVIESVLDILHEAPDFLCAAFAELLRILTNNATIAKEHPQCRADYTLTSQQAIEPLLSLLDSPASAVQQLAAELLSHLLLEEHLQRDPLIQQVIGPLVRILGSGIPILQQRAVRALVSVAVTWPNEIAKEGGVSELSKVILQADPLLPHALWESAASVLSSILQFSSEFYLEVPVAVLVRLLRSGTEATVIGALNALLVLESDDSTSAEAMAESGAIEALLDLLRSHQCEETAARLLEVLLNNVKIRESKATKSAIVPLSQYLLDPQTQGQQARLLATLALGDLFQNEALARTADAVSACRALVNLLEDQPTEEMKVVAICALQNLVMYSRSNKRAVAEAGGVQVVLDLIGSSDPETSIQAAMFIKLLFSNNTIQEYASSETVRAITVNEEYLKALNALFGNFPRLRATEPATLSIPHLVTSLKTGSEATQEAALDALFLLRQAWSACPAEVSRAQSIAAADAIPLLQYLIQSGPPRFQEKAEFLLQCLPGTLVVIIKRGNNMRQSVGNPSVYCKLTLGNTPPRQTKVVSTGPNPEWDESFAWSFESPPKGQKLHISCKNKSKMGKSSFGKVTIQIDRVVMLGAVAGEYTLLPESKSGPSRNLEIEFQWSNK
ncbi:UNVERIFIED_CONTAM: protein CELLULOSE SYNTHASE INTERACTIVE 1, partial [Sesamum radiatum]